MATAAEHRAEINRITTEVTAQAAKIAELSTILDGKAGGGNSREEKEAVLTFRNAGTCNLSYENANGVQHMYLTGSESATITYYDGSLIVCYRYGTSTGFDGIVNGATIIWRSSVYDASSLSQDLILASMGIVLTDTNVTIR